MKSISSRCWRRWGRGREERPFPHLPTPQAAPSPARPGHTSVRASPRGCSQLGPALSPPSNPPVYVCVCVWVCACVFRQDFSDSWRSYGPGSSVHGILQPILLECVAISFSRGSSQHRDQTQVSCIAGRVFTI